MRGRNPAEASILFLTGIALLVILLLMIAYLPAFSGIYKRMTSLFAAVTGVGRSANALC